MITTDYAALRYGSTPDTSRYVRRDREIIGAVLRDHDGAWSAYAADELLDLRTPLARSLPDLPSAIDAVVTARTNDERDRADRYRFMGDAD